MMPADPDSESEDLKLAEASSTNAAPYFNPNYIPISTIESDPSESGTGFNGAS